MGASVTGSVATVVAAAVVVGMSVVVGAAVVDSVCLPSCLPSTHVSVTPARVLALALKHT